MMAARGVEVSYETIRAWCTRFGPEYAAKLRRRHDVLRVARCHWNRNDWPGVVGRDEYPDGRAGSRVSVGDAYPVFDRIPRQQR